MSSFNASSLHGHREHASPPGPRSVRRLLSLPVVALAVACASTNVSAPPTRPPVLPAPPPAPTRQIHLELGADLLHCQTRDPHFFYDGTKVRPQDHEALEELAACLNEPDFKKIDLLLVGRTDPRGSAAYNQQLSKERADRVKDLLVENGVDAKRITTKAAGERGAIGQTHQASYGYDRRVDVVQLSAIVPRQRPQP